jgi:hypothetical protein
MFMVKYDVVLPVGFLAAVTVAIDQWMFILNHSSTSKSTNNDMGNCLGAS